MPVPCGACAQAAIASRGTANAAVSRMKPVLLLAFLALGPALAEQVPIVPPVVSDAVAQSSSTAPAAAPREAERIWLCGR
jgi:hypothetical protein